MTRMMNHDDVVIDIKAMLEQAEPPVTDECCIYGVPFDICKVKEDAYTPKVVSIGPFHHNRNPRLHIMERHKPIYCNAFLERTHTSLESWICYIEEVMPDFRRCYSDTLEFSTEEPGWQGAASIAGIVLLILDLFGSNNLLCLASNTTIECLPSPEDLNVHNNNGFSRAISVITIKAYEIEEG
ncbi:hypothetical protein D0Y65_008993 [Glycine soja]|uniref:Uncharacterized protein n=1 Tax=Glycine soja TaxID=3848 RepID=A0A445KWP7_GLYSO|nr:hypothetical protein D0Y65_008993 [Glycine soja]